MVIFKRMCFLWAGLLLVLMPAVHADGMTPVAAQAESLTLERFCEKVVAYYPALQAAHADVEVALGRQMQAKAGFWPSLNLSAGYQVSEEPVNVFGMLLRQERFTASDFDLKHLNTPRRHQDIAAGVHAEIPLWDAMQTIYRARSAAAEVKAGGMAEVFTRMEALLVAQDAFVNALTLDRLSLVLEEVLRRAAADMHKAVELKERGMILGADYYAARVMHGELMRLSHDMERQKHAMAVLVNILMGESGNRVWSYVPLAGDGHVPDGEARDGAVGGVDRRPDILALEARLEALDSDLRRERSTAWPSLGAFASAVNDRDRLAVPGGNNFTVGVRAQMPLFDPGRSGRLKEAVAQRARLASEIQTVKDDLRRAQAEEHARYAALRDNRGVFQAMADDAREAALLMEPLYNEGRKSIVDLMEMRMAYWQAVQANEKAMAGLRLARARLLFLSGELSVDNVVLLKEVAR